jgi:hypothetical protein
MELVRDDEIRMGLAFRERRTEATVVPRSGRSLGGGEGEGRGGEGGREEGGGEVGGGRGGERRSIDLAHASLPAAEVATVTSSKAPSSRNAGADDGAVQPQERRTAWRPPFAAPGGPLKTVFGRHDEPRHTELRASSPLMTAGRRTPAVSAWRLLSERFEDRRPSSARPGSAFGPPGRA